MCQLHSRRDRLRLRWLKESRVTGQPVLPPVPAERGVSGQAKQEQRGQGCGEVQPLSLLAGCELGQLLRPET